MALKYYCNTCLYSTNDKSNFNRHMNSGKHEKKVEDGLINPTPPLISPGLPTTNCKYCGCSFTRSCNMVRHLNICSEKKLKETKELEEEKNRVRKLEMELKLKEAESEMQIKIRDAQIEFLKEACKNKPTNNTYISVKNFVQQNYANAPPLQKLDDYSLLEFSEDFIDKLSYNQKNKILNKFLGDLLINWYKKEDPMQQSIWNSDVPRLSYVIKELMANNKSYWNQDQKGLKTKEYIINPLLQNIKNIIIRYLERIPLNIRNSSIEDITTLLENSAALSYIKKEIDDGTLCEDIVRYLAPYFSIEKNLLKN